jgi:hypothetical protein
MQMTGHADEPRDESPDEPGATVIVFRAGLSATFELAEAVLRSNDIPFIAVGDFDAIFRSSREIRVRAEDAEEARRLLATLS